jgi:hypothetical protein
MTYKLDVPALIETCHGAAKAGGWWHDINTGEPLKRNQKQLKMLIISELAEAMEGLRKDLMDDKLPHRKMEEVELADFVIRVCDFLGGTKRAFDQEGYLMYAESDDIASGDNRAALLYDMVTNVCSNFYELALATASRYALRFDLDLQGAIDEKIAFNAKRADHKPANRAAAGGKKF